MVLLFWLRRDDHLFAYEANLRQKLSGRRLDFFRCLAAELRSRYRTLYLEGDEKEQKGFDLTEFGRKPSPELEALAVTAQRRAARIGHREQCRPVAILLLRTETRPIARSF